MPLDDTFPLAVTFVVAERPTNATQSRVPIGTGFVIRQPSEAVPGLGFEYVVTAAHVVESGEPTWVRFRTRDGGIYDLDAPDWVLHPTADVAAAPLRGHGDYGLHLLNIPVEALVGTEGVGWAPTLGDRVYFLGLLSRLEEMGARNIPMVRSGTLGALYQERVPLRWPDGARRHVVAHLLDCRSYEGFSGAPCFVQRDEWRLGTATHNETGATQPVLGQGSATYLLGLVSGHFDDWRKARLVGDLGLEPGSVETEMNTGIGIVTPSEQILELLRLEEIAEDRERIEKEHLKREAEGGTLDAAAGEK